ncbi:hypothetical protein LXA43DRAFT_903100 [Ganoderma leucocontextum]|nr:hypothetical protein LXA43DRAFT_903100 [Ganoderma leucocontextum]
MVQSTLVLYGFFELLHSERKSSPRRTNPSALTYHNHYHTVLQCVDDSGLGAELQIFSLPADPVLTHRTVAFVNSRAYIPPGRDTILLEAFPGNPNDDNYQKHAPDLVYGMAYGVGVVKTNCLPVTVDSEKSFMVETTHLIRDENMTSTIR